MRLVFDELLCFRSVLVASPKTHLRPERLTPVRLPWLLLLLIVGAEYRGWLFRLLFVRTVIDGGNEEKELCS
jgi:hypothetical protein